MEILPDANIFKLIFEDETSYPNGDTLPSIWITEADYDADGQYVGHRYLKPYVSQDDIIGEEALWYGGALYDEGMQLRDPMYAKERLDCFKAAELLYRHSAGKGNLNAYLCLGYIYYYDRCKGEYWIDPKQDQEPFLREKRAFECFKEAADEGIAEASYKLGDCYKNGIGCEANEHEAFLLYKQAAKQDDKEDLSVTGSIVLRLADCYEEGRGCEYSFKEALKYYENAEKILDAAVMSGASYYNGPLRGARDGVKRCKQELSF